MKPTTSNLFFVKNRLVLYFFMYMEHEIIGLCHIYDQIILYQLLTIHIDHGEANNCREIAVFKQYISAMPISSYLVNYEQIKTPLNMAL